MNKLTIVLLASVFATGVANAADGAKDETRNVAQKTTRANAGSTPVTAAAPQLAGMSQQNKMKECNRLATGKKGAERKEFMKTCLSKKKA